MENQIPIQKQKITTITVIDNINHREVEQSDNKLVVYQLSVKASPPTQWSPGSVQEKKT